MGIRETGLFFVLSKILGPSKRSVFKDKTLSSPFSFFVVCSLFFSAHLVHALQLSLCTAQLLKLWHVLLAENKYIQYKGT